MATEIKVPTLGESVTSATVARWLKQAGETVAQDEPLVELETDKVTVEVPAPTGGVLTEISAREGAEVQIGAVLGRLDGAGAAKGNGGHKAEARPQSPLVAPTAKAPETATKPEAASATAAETSRPLPAAARLLEEKSVPAKALGAGSGKDGRITKGDVLAFLNRAKSADEPAQPPPKTPPEAPVERPPEAPPGGPAETPVVEPPETPPGRPAEAPPGRPAEAPVERPREARVGEERVRMTRLRRTIAARLKEAQNTAAMLTTFNEVDMSRVLALRAEYREAFEKKHEGVRLGFMSFFVRSAVVALQEFPAANAEIDGEEIVYKHFVHMGIAVGGSNGLVVPVIRHAERMGFAEIERAVADFGKRARAGTLKLEELTGGTFSITNGGVYGSLMSTPILNPPQSAILGMHKIQERPVAVGGKVEIRPMMYLALSYDHRIVDGREAVSFLVRLKEGIEDPRRLLLEI